MHLQLTPLFLLLPLLPTSLTNPALQPSAHPLTIPNSPASFSVLTTLTPPRLRQTSTLMASITALRVLALHSYDARIPDGTEYVSPLYPQVGISISTARRKRSLPALYVVWAIVLGLKQMIAERRFEFAQFEMKWDGEVVGWVHVVDNPSGLSVEGGGAGQEDRNVNVARRSPSAGSLASIGRSPINKTAVTMTTGDIPDPAEARLTTTFTPHGTNLGIYDVFLPIMNALSDMASYPSTQRTEGLVAGFEGYQGIVCILPREPLEYQWLIRAIARIPGYMLEQSRFGEIDIKMWIDGEEVAFGRVTNVTACLKEIEREESSATLVSLVTQAY